MGFGAHNLRVNVAWSPCLMTEHTPIRDLAALSFLPEGNGAQSMHLAARRLT